MSNVYEKLAKAWKVSCPLVSLTTSDPAATVRKIGKAIEAPVVLWDCVVGATAAECSQHKAAIEAAGTIGDMVNPVEALMLAAKLPPGTVFVMQNAHRYLDEIGVLQAVWNLRDQFKSQRRMLILLGPSFRLPVELQHDIVELDEPLPSQEELQKVIKDLGAAASLEVDSEAGAIAATGLSAFAAEQLAALNLSKSDGLSVKGLWDDKCRKIDETPGLRVVTGGTFDDIAGVDAAKQFMRRLVTGKKAPKTIVYVDEIEKSIGGASNDTSGVSQDQLGVLLQWMQDKRASGCILVGPPGAAKSAFAKCTGGEAGVPTIQLDLGGMKGSLVGESEGRIRDSLKVIDAVSGGNTLWLATCNSISSLPPELRRRFRFGTWFFDLPTLEERKAIWKLYCGKFGVDGPCKQLLGSEFTGAEIESCCDIADRCGISVGDAAEYIVPVSKSGARQIESLRAAADGCFLSASTPGVYTRVASAVSTARDFG